VRGTRVAAALAEIRGRSRERSDQGSPSAFGSGKSYVGGDHSPVGTQGPGGSGGATFPDAGKTERGNSAVSRASRWPAEVLREGGSIGLQEQRVMGHIYLGMHAVCPLAKDPPNLICRESA
jgi:hypothetical protein